MKKLVRAKSIPDDTRDDITRLIQRRRYQILVHSLIYYELDRSIISDDTWHTWAEELIQLQKDNPEKAVDVIFHEAFKEFDGSTGFNLPYQDEQIIRIARRLVREDEEALAKLEEVPCVYNEYEKYRKKSKPSLHTFNRKEVKPVERKQESRKTLFKTARG